MLPEVILILLKGMPSEAGGPEYFGKHHLNLNGALVQILIGWYL